MSEKRKVTMDDALKAGDSVILREQAKRIKELEQLVRDAHREGFHKAREVAKANYHGPYHRSFFDWSKARAAIAKAKGEE